MRRSLDRNPWNQLAPYQSLKLFDFIVPKIYSVEDGAGADGGGAEETVDSGDEEDSPDLPVQRGSDRSGARTPGAHHRGRDRLRQNHADPAVPLRGGELTTSSVTTSTWSWPI